MDATIKFLTTLAGIVEGITLDQALRIVEASADLQNLVVEPDFTTHEGLLAYSRGNEAIVQHIKDSRKIQAIKTLRDAALTADVKAGLRECKDAIDALAREVAPDLAPANRLCCSTDAGYSHSIFCYNYND